MLHHMASDRMSDIRRQATSATTSAGTARRQSPRQDRPHLRSRIGFTLIEAGLRLLAGAPSGGRP
jgi:hypothetical protein